ncbi:kinetochore-associated protein 1 [Cephus cinctus]|uniref:Kinetochore-associated protein 1 n=1 Tax=Cephus cinctus TaxID=211228 RepID=A0AAJ7BLX2_CEPCN|nr:kinetochore-associated protein 1 [Cephus cinctus]XP_015589358.1 kinetochore-associated protein 1 [Cephus cinctus]XP_015589359.1 kinetochore-associated protein 1 [Cephus cinctus]XP_015589360.1 kinetochore-associated protein 1 [Cephus cinctus]XP_015589363.1 kinetochore-associated protein 1 [Cephus cinctus]XP_024938385.1 kinetochore-associated protein 1 [Cephus cinctus]
MWSKILSGFDPEEETVNFGARTVAENDGSIYEASTLATIQSDEQVTTNPTVQASIQCAKLCVAVDKTITIFSNEICQEILLSVSFDSYVTSYCISDVGSFLFLTLSNGSLSCLHLLTRGQLVFVKNIFNDEECNNKIEKVFLEQHDKFLDVFLVASNSTIYSMPQFNAELISSLLLKKDDSIINDIVNNMQFHKMTSTVKNKITHVQVGTISNVPSVVMCGEKFTVWLNNQFYYSDSWKKYIKVQFQKYSTLLCLCKDHCLSMVCPLTLLSKKIWNGPVLDFILIQEKFNDPPRILMLMVPEEGSLTTILQVLTVPDFDVKFKMTVPSTTYLVDFYGSAMDDIIFLEGLRNPSNIVNTISVKAISECLPEYRLARLLRRGKFDEAEVFAKNFRLDMKPIYNAKASLLMSQFDPWSNTNDQVNKVDALIDILDKITDVTYVSQCCIKALVTEHEQIRKLLLYARERLTHCIEKSNNNDLTKLLSTVNSTLHKLETFTIIQKIKSDKEHVDNEWIQFSKENLLDECAKYLLRAELEIAALIWARHLPSFISKLNVGIIRNMLNIIPLETPLDKLRPWLCHFIPSLLSVFPSSLSEIIPWSCNFTKRLEKLNPAQWPLIGLDFVSGLMELLKLEESQLCFYLQQQYTTRNSPLQHLMTLNQALNDLQQLKSNHRVTIPLDMYMGEPIEVVYLLLNTVRSEETSALTLKFLQQYMFNHSLKNDSVFISYIQRILNRPRDYWYSGDLLREVKLATVVGFIHNVENRLEQTLHILRKAPVPWSETMVALAKSSYAFDHPLTMEIKNESDSIPTKLILKKYQCEHVSLNNRLIMYIIKQNRNDMIDDIRELTKRNDTFKATAFSMCVNFYLSNGDIDKAMTLISNLDNDIAAYCCEQIIYRIVANFKLKIMSASIEHYMEVLNIVTTKLSKIYSKKDPLTMKFNETILIASYLRPIYCLRKEFNINVSLANYQSEKEELLNNYIKCILNEMQSTNGEISLRFVYKKTQRVAHLLGIPSFLAACLLLEETKNLEVIRQCSLQLKDCFESIPASEICYITRLCSSSILIAGEDLQALSFLKELSATALSSCHPNQLRDILMSIQWMKLFETTSEFDVSNEAESKYDLVGKTDWNFITIYRDKAICIPQTIFSFIRDAFRIYLYCAGPLDTTNSQIAVTRTNSTAGLIEEMSMTEMEIENLFKTLLDRVKDLQLEHLNYGLLLIAKTLYFSCATLLPNNATIIGRTYDMIMHCVFPLLLNVINDQYLDMHLGLACLFMVSETAALSWLHNICKSYRCHYTRHNTLMELAYEYCRLIKDKKQTENFYHQRVLQYWSRKLTDNGLSCRDIQSSTTETKRKILDGMMQSEKENIMQLIEEFCKSFGFDLDECFILYIRVVLKKWCPQLNFTTISGRKELKIDEVEVERLRKKCKTIAARIEDKVAMKRHILSLSSEINFYHYEVFLIIYELAEDRNEKKISLFYFLKHYTRVGSPTALEREEWSQLCLENSLPEIADWRLPFLPQIDQWKIITPELNLRTYEKWLKIAPVLDLQECIICILAVKGAVTQAWGNVDSERSNNEWLIYPKNTSLLEDVKKCIQRMTDEEALYYGTAALYYVVNHTAQGADQVAAAKECYILANKWALQSSNTDEEMIKKIKYKYLRVTSKHILYTHGLGEDRYLALTMTPVQLVRDLYMDESIALRGRGAAQRKPDINSAVTALGDLFNINVIKLRLELLQEWLQPDIKQSLSFESYSSDINIVITDDNLLRACYIIECSDLILSANFLINIVFEEGTETCDYRPGMRYRALQVLQSIMTPDMLQDLTKRNLNDIRRYMKSLQYLSELEIIGMSYNISTLEVCSKHKLAQILWRAHSYMPRALSLILQLCMDFKLQDYSLWDSTLTQMAKLLMITELKKVLPAVGTVSHIVNCNGFTSSWQVVILDPFRKSNMKPTPNQMDDCIRTLILLHSCPIASKLNYKEIIKYCFRCEQPHLAAAFLPFLPEDDKKYVLQKIKDTYDIANVVKDLQALSSKGIFTTPCLQILQDERR